MKYLENRIPPPLVAVIFGAGMFGAAMLTPAVELSSIVRYSAIGFFSVLGALFLVSGAISFRLARTTVDPLKPESATSLVTSGVYQITRNPMYVGLAMFLCAWAVYLESFWVVCLIVLYILYIHRFQIRPEEKALENIFGQEFANYKSQARPWL